MKERCVFILLNGEVTVYHQINLQSKWMNLLISGERIDIVKTPFDLNEVIERINDDLNREHKLENIEIIVLYANSDIKLLKSISSHLDYLNCRKWQILCWEPLFHRANLIQAELSNKPLENMGWLTDVFLPLLNNLLGIQETTLQESEKKAKIAHEETMETLRQERQILELEKARLEQQLQTMFLPDIENLIVYLPIIYHNFWTHVKPSDLALLAGNCTIPDIQTPYPEPDANTISIMKKRLQNLRFEEQDKLRKFCLDLEYPNLKVRSEMRFFLNS